MSSGPNFHALVKKTQQLGLLVRELAFGYRDIEGWAKLLSFIHHRIEPKWAS